MQSLFWWKWRRSCKWHIVRSEWHIPPWNRAKTAKCAIWKSVHSVSRQSHSVDYSLSFSDWWCVRREALNVKQIDWQCIDSEQVIQWSVVRISSIHVWLPKSTILCMFVGEPGKNDSLIPVLLSTLAPLPWSMNSNCWRENYKFNSFQEVHEATDKSAELLRACFRLPAEAS